MTTGLSGFTVRVASHGRVRDHGPGAGGGTWTSRLQRPLAGHVVGSRGLVQTVRAQVNQFVRAPIQRVYSAYVDPALLAKVMGLQAIIDVSGPLDRPGATFAGVVFGPYRPRSEVLAAEPPVLHDMGGQAGLGMGWRWTARLAVEDEGTEITVDVEARFPAGPITGLLRRSQEGGRMGRGTAQHLATFAKLVEASETRRIG